MARPTRETRSPAWQPSVIRPRALMRVRRVCVECGLGVGVGMGVWVWCGVVWMWCEVWEWIWRVGIEYVCEVWM